MLVWGDLGTVYVLCNVDAMECLFKQARMPTFSDDRIVALVDCKELIR